MGTVGARIPEKANGDSHWQEKDISGEFSHVITFHCRYQLEQFFHSLRVIAIWIQVYKGFSHTKLNFGLRTPFKIPPLIALFLTVGTLN